MNEKKEILSFNGTQEIKKDYETLLKMAGVRPAIVKENNGRKNTGVSFLYREAVKIALPILQAKYANGKRSN